VRRENGKRLFAFQPAALTASVFGLTGSVWQVENRSYKLIQQHLAVTPFALTPKVAGSNPAQTNAVSLFHLENRMTLNRILSIRGISPAGLPGVVLAAALLAATTPLLAAQAAAPGGAPPAPGAAQRQPPPPPTAGMHATLIDGSSASYTVTEQLVGINFPNDAIGTTPTLTGNLTIAADGSIPSGSSKFSADLRDLRSDQSQRDGYIRKNVLDTDKYPTAEFVPTKIQGVPQMIPFQGQAGVQITGNLTIHGVTKEVTFQGITTFAQDGTVAGRAKTTFTFDTFGLPKPSIARLMSVDDKITLELVYRLKRS
jgi:polyisoprenoid-binding protein YceI